MSSAGSRREWAPVAASSAMRLRVRPTCTQSSGAAPATLSPRLSTLQVVSLTSHLDLHTRLPARIRHECHSRLSCLRWSDILNGDNDCLARSICTTYAVRDVLSLRTQAWSLPCTLACSKFRELRPTHTLHRQASAAGGSESCAGSIGAGGEAEPRDRDQRGGAGGELLRRLLRPHLRQEGPRLPGVPPARASCSAAAAGAQYTASAPVALNLLAVVRFKRSSVPTNR